MDQMSHVNPIEYATTKDLLAVLFSRFEDCIFMGTLKRNEGLDELGNVKTMKVERWRWKGDLRRCQGIAFTLAKRMSDVEDSDLELVDPEEV